MPARSEKNGPVSPPPRTMNTRMSDSKVRRLIRERGLGYVPISAKNLFKIPLPESCYDALLFFNTLSLWVVSHLVYRFVAQIQFYWIHFMVPASAKYERVYGNDC